MVTCLIGLGSNLGDRVGNLLAAIALLRQDPAISLQAVSSFVEPCAGRRTCGAIELLQWGRDPGDFASRRDAPGTTLSR